MDNSDSMVEAEEVWDRDIKNAIKIAEEF